MRPPRTAGPEAGEPPPAASLASIPLRRGGASRSLPPAAPPLSAVPRGDDRGAVIAWWEGLRRGRAMPATADLDRAAIAAAWPEAMLLAYDAPQDNIAGAIRLGPGALVAGAIVEYSPMVTEWVLAASRRAARSAAPIEEERSFAVGRGLVLYRLFVLPLGSGPVDHVLCHIAVS